MQRLLKRTWLGQPGNLQKILSYSLYGWAFSASLSPFFVQIFFYTFLVFSLFNLREALAQRELRWLLVVSLAWVFALLVSVGASIEPVRSGSESLKFTLYLFVPFAVSLFISSLGEERTRRIINLIVLLALGQGVAALHTVVSAAFNSTYYMGLVGEVTEGGQLALTIPALLGVICSGSELRYQRVGSLLALSLLLLGWGDEVFGVSLQLVGLFGCIYAVKKLAAGTFRFHALQFGLAAVLISAFLINLKRGPWFGVFVGLVSVGLMLRPKLAVKTVVLSLLAVVGLPPVRERLFNFAADFSISGGRERMWELGVEIAQRFPLGVGLRSANFMRILDPYLPANHQHLHNNFLNVLVELGYLGLIVYLWWLIAVVGYGFSFIKLVKSSSAKARRIGLLGVFLAASLTSSICAGVVEYNLGDADIRRIFFLVVGLLVSLPVALSQDQGNHEASS